MIGGLSPFRDVSPISNAPSCIDLTKSWINTCLASHPDCRLPASTTPFTPTRLIDCQPENPTLIVPAELNPPDPGPTTFVALSHCWGKSPQPLRTLTTNILAHRTGIPSSSLPLTFRDAIALTRTLGFRYIWIDSLCIVQDSPADWEAEAAKMALVYGHAALVLGATSSARSSDGFLATARKDAATAGTVHVQHPVDWGRRVPVRYRACIDHFAPPHAAEPLQSRAWTFQERALARRFVSFGSRELAWECRTLLDCECDFGMARQQRPDVFSRAQFADSQVGRFRLMVGVAGMAERMTEPSFAHNTWRMYVAAPYSGRDLTFAGDKLVALSALAGVFGDEYLGGRRHGDDRDRGGEYLAGLWRGELVQHLCWFCPEGPGAVLGDSEAGYFYAPSWTWASIDGGVAWPISVKGFSETVCEVVDVHCEPASQVIPFGSVKEGAFVTLRGRVSAGVVLCEVDGNGAVRYRMKGLEENQVFCDVPLENVEGGENGHVLTTVRGSKYNSKNAPVDGTEHPVFCMVLGMYRMSGTNTVVGLVLGASPSHQDKFVRLGLVKFDLHHTLHGMQDLALSKWEQKIVTIV